MGSLGVNLGRISGGMSGLGALLMAGRLMNFGSGRKSASGGDSGGHMKFGSGKAIPLGNGGPGFAGSTVPGGAGQLGSGAGWKNRSGGTVGSWNYGCGSNGRGGRWCGRGKCSGRALGVAVGALVTNRTFWKVIISLLLSVLLFVFILVNGVGIIMAYLGFGDADGYVAQARTAEYENIKNQIDTLLAEDSQLAEEIYELIEGERDSLYEKVEEDFDDNWEDYDGYEVETDEYETVLKPNLSRYLAVLIEEEWSGSRGCGDYADRKR